MATGSSWGSSRRGARCSADSVTLAVTAALRARQVHEPSRRAYRDRESAHGLPGELPPPRIVVFEPAEQVVTRMLLRAPDSLSRGGAAMEQVRERSAGLDAHQKAVAVCARGPGANGDRLSLAHLGRFAEAVEPEGEAIWLAGPPHHAYTVGLACDEGERARAA